MQNIKSDNYWKLVTKSVNYLSFRIKWKLNQNLRIKHNVLKFNDRIKTKFKFEV